VVVVVSLKSFKFMVPDVNRSRGKKNRVLWKLGGHHMVIYVGDISFQIVKKFSQRPSK
jgi:hypothetical protein